MKKIISISLVCLLITGLFSACGKSLEADRDTVYIQKKGTVVGAAIADFDKDYYVNIEKLGNKNPIYRCWYIDGDYFLLQLYKNGVESMISDGTNADVSELAIFDAENQTLKMVSGLPTDMSIGGEPYAEDGSVYIPINVTTGGYPAFYKVDAATGNAVKGLTVKAESIQTVGKLNIAKE